MDISAKCRSTILITIYLVILEPPFWSNYNMVLLFLELHCGGMISTKTNVVSTMLPPDTTPLRLLISSFLFIITTTLMRESYQTSSSDGSPITSQVPFEIMKAPYIIQLFLWRSVTKKFCKLIVIMRTNEKDFNCVTLYHKKEL